MADLTERRSEFVYNAARLADKLQADLDAALDWIEHDEEESIPPPGLYQHIKALLENRRQKRG